MTAIASATSTDWPVFPGSHDLRWQTLPDRCCDGPPGGQYWHLGGSIAIAPRLVRKTPLRCFLHKRKHQHGAIGLANDIGLADHARVSVKP
ncbi:hypothetical protein OpiT1DRAFT_04173 [Opitutaceae bacterium TAV1]|nr:hypothetical protein OpiT1DRAFT_04173 [Opitutaceae bacterium TAV1]